MSKACRGLVSLLALLALSSCGEEPPPEGYELRMRFISLDPSVLENLRLTFTPRGTSERFTMVEPMSYEGGAITLEVATDGVTELTIDGAYVAAHSTPDGTGAFQFPLEIWSSDLQPRAMPPGVLVVGNRAGEAIAEGYLFLPEWPVPLGENALIPVTCKADAASRGLCQP